MAARGREAPGPSRSRSVRSRALKTGCPCTFSLAITPGESRVATVSRGWEASPLLWLTVKLSQQDHPIKRVGLQSEEGTWFT